jgi:hypothetical protein
MKRRSKEIEKNEAASSGSSKMSRNSYRSKQSATSYKSALSGRSGGSELEQEIKKNVAY